MRFVMDEQTEEDSREVRIEQMSDGYRIMVAMVADIASRLAEMKTHWTERESY